MATVTSQKRLPITVQPYLICNRALQPHFFFVTNFFQIWPINELMRKKFYNGPKFIKVEKHDFPVNKKFG